jgi:hypothetical protein
MGLASAQAGHQNTGTVTVRMGVVLTALLAMGHSHNGLMPAAVLVTGGQVAADFHALAGAR